MRHGCAAETTAVMGRLVVVTHGAEVINLFAVLIETRVTTRLAIIDGVAGLKTITEQAVVAQNIFWDLITRVGFLIARVYRAADRVVAVGW